MQRFRQIFICLFILLLFGCTKPTPEQISFTTSGRVPVNGAEIYYETYGKGHPLLLLHGGYMDINTWENQIPELSKYYRVIAIDSRGHGASTDSNAPLSYQGLTSDTIALMDYLKIPSAHVVGWSDGSVIAAQMSIYHPSRITKSVLIGTTVQFENAFNLLDQWFISNATLFKLYADVMLRDSYNKQNQQPENWSVFRDKVYSMWKSPCYLSSDVNTSCFSLLSTIETPTLLVVGENEMIRQEHTDKIHKSIRNSKLIVVKDADHFVAMQKPREINEIILEFLK